VYFYAVSVLISGVITLEIINNRDNPAYKIAWIVPILILPLFGWMLYLVFGRNRFWPKEQARIKAMRDRIHTYLPDYGALGELTEHSLSAANQSRYIQRYSYTHPCKNTYSEYFTLGEFAFDRMKEEFKKAKRYIFLEYFIVEEGKMWNELLEILVKKVQEGVDVRLIYDDMGCIFTLPYRYDRKLRKLGIQCERFAPFSPELSSRFNNRSHRKIAVVDGHTAFTGGINLADEYINAVVKFGHWKDTAILLQGDAAWTMTAMFLSMWDYVTGTQQNYFDFAPSVTPVLDRPCTGYVQPYFDSPLDGEAVCETIYINVIAKAERYVYITTPYLVLDNEMMTALCSAAKSGVDVRVITPHIPDKWYVLAVTRHNYMQLIESGVRIFEYTPGFIHAKSFVADDIYGVVGTVNLDFRSLYLHYECGVWLYGTDSIREILSDFHSTLARSEEITLANCKKVSYPRRLGRAILSVFAPLM
jgi:cardiolipin synthase